MSTASFRARASPKSPPVGEGGLLEPPPEPGKLSTFASVPIKIGPKCAIEIGLVQPIKLSDKLKKKHVALYFLFGVSMKKN